MASISLMTAFPSGDSFFKDFAVVWPAEGFVTLLVGPKERGFWARDEEVVGWVDFRRVRGMVLRVDG